MHSWITYSFILINFTIPAYLKSWSQWKIVFNFHINFQNSSTFQLINMHFHIMVFSCLARSLLAPCYMLIAHFANKTTFNYRLDKQYNWNIVESGIKHHRTNQPTDLINDWNNVVSAGTFENGQYSSFIGSWKVSAMILSLLSESSRF